jgi:general secretion pathway protein G
VSSVSVYREQPQVFFPWERRRGLRSVFRRARARQILLVAGGIAAFVVLRQRELGASQVRATRAAITSATRGISAWRSDHERACPPSIDDLVSAGYFAELPRDAWGRPLRVTCPGRKDPQGFDVSSDGPDGVPGGLDRVE